MLGNKLWTPFFEFFWYVLRVSWYVSKFLFHSSWYLFVPSCCRIIGIWLNINHISHRMLRTTFYQPHLIWTTSHWYHMLRTKSHYFHLIWTEFRVGVFLLYDKEWGDASCQNIIGHRWIDKSVQLAALWRRNAPPALTDYWAQMQGKVGATWRPLAASCTSGIYGLLYQPKGHKMTWNDKK